MTTYRVYLRSDLQWAMRNFKARSPEHAIALARCFADEHFFELDFEDYERNDYAINEIEVCDADGETLIVWLDNDLRVRLAAPELLAAAENVVANWERGDLAAPVRELAAAIATAKEGAG